MTPLLFKRKPNALCTHLQIAKANPQSKFAKEYNIFISYKNTYSFIVITKKNISLFVNLRIVWI